MKPVQREAVEYIRRELTAHGIAHEVVWGKGSHVKVLMKQLGELIVVSRHEPRAMAIARRKIDALRAKLGLRPGELYSRRA